MKLYHGSAATFAGLLPHDGLQEVMAVCLPWRITAAVAGAVAGAAARGGGGWGHLALL